MSPIGNLIAFALRQALGIEAGAAIDAIENRLQDHSQVLPKAIERANAQSWQALAVALAGEGLFDQVKVLFASGDEKAFREEVRRFLADSPVRYDRNPAEFRKKCLAELHQAQRAGLLSSRGISGRHVARFDRYADPTRLLNGAWQAVGQVAEQLKPHCPNLAKLIGHQTPGKPPLLIAAFAYFFRRQVETNNELAHGLFFQDLQQLRLLSASQEKALGNIGQTLAALDGRFDLVLEKLGGIEAVVVSTHDNVLELVAEQHRNGQKIGQKLDEMYGLIMRLEEQHQLQRRPLRSQDSLSVRNDRERHLIEQVKALFRSLPEQQQRQLPAALNAIGKLEVVAGDFEAAQKDFQQVASLVSDPKAQAEAHYNAATAGTLQKLAAAVPRTPQEQVCVLEGHSGVILCAAFSADARRAITGSEDRTLCLWDTKTGMNLKRYVGHSGKVCSVAFSPNGEQVLSGSDDNTFRLWNAETGEVLRRFGRRRIFGGGKTYRGLAFSPNGTQILSSEICSICLWDVASGSKLLTLGHPYVIVDGDPAFSPDGLHAIYATTQHTSKDEETTYTLSVCDLTTGREVRQFRGQVPRPHPNFLNTVVFSPDGRRIMVAFGNGTMDLWSMGSNEGYVRFGGQDSSLNAVAFCPGGRFVLSGEYGDNASVRLWDTETGLEVARTPCPPNSCQRAFSLDGQYALFANIPGNTARIWRVPKPG